MCPSHRRGVTRQVSEEVLGGGLKSRAVPAPTRICSTPRPHLLWPWWSWGEKRGSLGDDTLWIPGWRQCLSLWPLPGMVSGVWMLGGTEHQAALVCHLPTLPRLPNQPSALRMRDKQGCSNSKSRTARPFVLHLAPLWGALGKDIPVGPSHCPLPGPQIKTSEHTQVLWSQVRTAMLWTSAFPLGGHHGPDLQPPSETRVSQAPPHLTPWGVAGGNRRGRPQCRVCCL